VARFSDEFAGGQARIEALAELSRPLTPIRALLENAPKSGFLSTEDAASLITARRDASARAEVEAAAKRARAQRAGNVVEFIIPVYLTSFCQNDCLYCGYRKSNPVAERVRLSLDSLAQELDLILSWGHRQIELVLSDDPELGARELIPYVELTRRKLEEAGGGVVALCSPVYEETDYRRLRAAGLDWVVEWQETYHQPHFDRWHTPGSPKRHYEARLDLWDTTIAAGLKQIGMGVLLGLYDWRFDVLAVIEHGNYLRRTYGIEPHAIGIPRLKPARGVLASQKPSRFAVSDDDFRLIVSLYHLAFPHSRLFFNTRESYELNLSLVAGGDLFTVDCETLPGGYLRKHLPGQFSIHYYPPRREVVEALRQRGFASRYLAEEKERHADGLDLEHAAPAPSFSIDDWARQHDEILERVTSFERDLADLESMPPEKRREAALSLRRIIEFFQSTAIEHCRLAEKYLTAGLPEPQRQALVQYHERFGMDLDKFERQIVSYELSGDPTVLLTLGARICREFRDHLASETRIESTHIRA